MKVSTEHLTMLRESVAPLDTEATRTRYLSGDFPRADRVKNLDMRYRWDLAWASGVLMTDTIRDASYKDAHIDTALRSIIPALEAK